MTWAEVTRRLRQRHVVLDAEEGYVILARQVNGSVQPQVVKHIEAFGAPWVMVQSNAGLRTALAPEEALRHNATLAVGSLALEGRFYVLRYCVPLSGLDGAAFDLALDMIAHESERLRRRELEVTAHFVD